MEQITDYRRSGMDAANEILKPYEDDLQGIFEKIRLVHGVANKTNLLAINASIETIHAMDLLQSFESIVGQNLLMQGRMLATIFRHDPDILMESGVEFGRKNGIEEIYVTDEEGIVRFTNVNGSLGASLKHSEVLPILSNPELEVVLAAKSNGMDSEHLKIVAVGLHGGKGIIQLGSRFTKPKGQLAINGFGVVAQEAKRLADVSKDIAERIGHLTDQMGGEVSELLLAAGSTENFAEVDKGGQKGNEQVADMLQNLRKSFREVSFPLTELINIARQTNLLGVRAAIEAAHSTNDKQDFDLLLNKHMLIEAKLLSSTVEIMDMVEGKGMESITDYCDRIGIGETWITDEFGRVEMTNVEGGVGFVFKNEGQTAPYMGILSNPELEVTAPPASRALDNKIFKYAGVGRRGKKGIVQLGIPSRLYGQSTAEGFSVVAKQIKALSEQSRELTKEIEEIIEKMDGRAVKALQLLENNVRHVSSY